MGAKTLRLTMIYEFQHTGEVTAHQDFEMLQHAINRADDRAVFTYFGIGEDLAKDIQLELITESEE